MFDWLESTPVAIWVGESSWAYPFWLSLHVIGLAIVVGIFAMRDLKLLGMFRGIEPTAFLSIIKLAWIGFAINAFSGALLFSSQATMFVTNKPFLIKISFIGIAAILAAVTQNKLRAALAAAPHGQVNVTARVIAACSLFFWFGAIVAGRLIAYV